MNPLSSLMNVLPAMLAQFLPRSDLEQRIRALDQDPEVQKVKALMTEYFNLQEQLHREHSFWPWNNPVGDLGEYVACTALGMTFAGAGNKGYDVELNGQAFQVKTMHQGNMPGFRGTFDQALLFQVDHDGIPRVVFCGTHAEVQALSKHCSTDNKYQIKLAKISDILGLSEREIRDRVKPFNDQIAAHRAEMAPVTDKMRRMFDIQRQLKDVNKDFKWNNLVGDCAEFLAVKLGMDKANQNQKGFDGTLMRMLTQVKGIMEGDSIGLRKSSQDAEALLALQFNKRYSGTGENRVVTGFDTQVVYFGPIRWVLARMGALNATTGPGNWDNKWSIHLTALRKLAEVQEVMTLVLDVPKVLRRIGTLLHDMLEKGQHGRKDARKNAGTTMDLLHPVARAVLGDYNERVMGLSDHDELMAVAGMPGGGARPVQRSRQAA